MLLSAIVVNGEAVENKVNVEVGKNQQNTMKFMSVMFT